MIRARLIVLCFVALGAFAACESETGPDAPKRSSGCIDTDCNGTSSSSGTDTSSSSSGSSDAGSDAEK